MFLFTSQLDPRERREAWLDAIEGQCGAFNVDFGEGDFEASLEVGHVGNFRCARLMQNTRTTRREGALTATFGESRYFLIVQLAGQSLLEQHRSSVRLMIGDVGLLDANAPFSIAYFGRNVQLSVHVPKDAPGVDSGEWNKWLAHKVPTRPARMLSAIACAAFEHGKPSSAPWADVVDNAIVGLFSNGLGYEVPRAGAEDQPAMGTIKRTIAASIDDPALSPALIAQACGLSERQLHRLFAPTGETFSCFVRNLRLDRCAEELSDPMKRGATVTDIALRWGFSDVSHFSRTFRTRFGQPPKVFRAAALAPR